MLLEVGYDSMSPYDRNRLLTQLANVRELDIRELTEDLVLEYHKELKSNMLSLKCEELIIKGFKSSNGYTYRTNRDDQINMIGQKDMLDKNEDVSVVYWKTEEEGYIEHSREDWLEQVYAEGYKHKEENLFKYNGLRTEVLKATKHDDIVAVQWVEETEEEDKEEEVEGDRGEE